MADDRDFKRREAEIEKSRRELAALRERIKKRAKKRDVQNDAEKADGSSADAGG
jgi:hypothetical protein